MFLRRINDFALDNNIVMYRPKRFLAITLFFVMWCFFRNYLVIVSAIWPIIKDANDSTYYKHRNSISNCVYNYLIYVPQQKLTGLHMRSKFTRLIVHTPQRNDVHMMKLDLERRNRIHI